MWGSFFKTLAPRDMQKIGVAGAPGTWGKFAPATPIIGIFGGAGV